MSTELESSPPRLHPTLGGTVAIAALYACLPGLVAGVLFGSALSLEALAALPLAYAVLWPIFVVLNYLPIWNLAMVVIAGIRHQSLAVGFAAALCSVPVMAVWRIVTAVEVR